MLHRLSTSRITNSCRWTWRSSSTPASATDVEGRTGNVRSGGRPLSRLPSHAGSNERFDGNIQAQRSVPQNKPSQGHAQEPLSCIRIRQGSNNRDVASRESLLKISWNVSLCAVEESVDSTPLRFIEGRVILFHWYEGWVELNKVLNAAYRHTYGDIW